MASKKSTRIALGGVFSSLCLLLMFMSSMVPFSSFVLPMLAGAALAVIEIENGGKTAWLVYISVSLLSVFIVADIDAKLMFILFFGYYPILKPRLERAATALRRIFMKLLTLNAAMVTGYFASVYLFGLGEAANQSEISGKYMPLFMLAGLNITFIMYDFLLSRYITLYREWFKPTFLH